MGDLGRALIRLGFTVSILLLIFLVACDCCGECCDPEKSDDKNPNKDDTNKDSSASSTSNLAERSCYKVGINEEAVPDAGA